MTDDLSRPPPTLERFLMSERAVPDVPAETRERLWRRIERTLAGGPAGGGGGRFILPGIAALVVAIAATVALVERARPRHELASTPSGNAVAEVATTKAPRRIPPRLRMTAGRGAPAFLSALEVPRTRFGQPGVPDRRVAGQVVLGGAPVAGALVTLSGIYAAADRRLERQVVTAANGRFLFDPVDAWDHRVVATAPGCRSASVPVSLASPRQARMAGTLVLKLGPCEVVMTGRVVDGSTHGVPGARVRHVHDGSFHGAQVDTDDEGRWELCTSSGPSVYRLRIDADGYGSQLVAIEASGQRIVTEVRLEPEGVAEGVVVRRPDDRPIAGAHLFTFPVGKPPGTAAPVHACCADEQGRFQIRGLSAGRYGLNAWATDAVHRVPMEFTVETGKSTSGLVRRLDTTTTVALRVLSDGRAVEDLSVVLAQGRGGYSFPSYTQEDGSAIVHGVFPGLNLVKIDGATIVRPTEIGVPSGGTGPVTIEVVRR